MKDLDIISRVALECVALASRSIVEAREKSSFEVNYKGVRDLVTSADLTAEKIIIDKIKREFPEHGILSEENFTSLPRPDEMRKPLWIIDPIDGTTNFAQGHLHVAVSIAFAFEGTVEVGVVGAPFLNETFSAIRGRGAFLNDEMIATSKTTELASALIATGFPYVRDDIDPIIERVRRVLTNCRDIRRLGSAALDLCWVACGRMDGYYETVLPWDMAAGALIAREAGARVGSMSERLEDDSLPDDLYCHELLAAPELLYQKLHALLSL